MQNDISVTQGSIDSIDLILIDIGCHGHGHGHGHVTYDRRFMMGMSWASHARRMSCLASASAWAWTYAEAVAAAATTRSEAIFIMLKVKHSQEKTREGEREVKVLFGAHGAILYCVLNHHSGPFELLFRPSARPAGCTRNESQQQAHANIAC